MSFEVSCPKCKKRFTYHSSEFRPFCSERCRLMDLGQWLNESYAVPASKVTEEEMSELERVVHEKDEEDDQEEGDEGDRHN